MEVEVKAAAVKEALFLGVQDGRADNRRGGGGTRGQHPKLGAVLARHSTVEMKLVRVRHRVAQVKAGRPW